ETLFRPTGRDGKQSFPGDAFPNRVWERGNEENCSMRDMANLLVGYVVLLVGHLAMSVGAGDALKLLSASLISGVQFHYLERHQERLTPPGPVFSWHGGHVGVVSGRCFLKPPASGPPTPGGRP